LIVTWAPYQTRNELRNVCNILDFYAIALFIALDKYQLASYIVTMIKSFRHKGLRLLFEDDDRRKLNAEHVDRLRLILSVRSLKGEDHGDEESIPSG